MNGNNEYGASAMNGSEPKCEGGTFQNVEDREKNGYQNGSQSGNGYQGGSQDGTYQSSGQGRYENGAYPGSGNRDRGSQGGYRGNNGYYWKHGYRAYGENTPGSSVLLVGIAGGTGSGKSTFTRELVKRFKGNVTVLTHDNYYKAHDDMTFEEREQINYDEPDAYETELLVEHLKLLKSGQSVESPVYDFTVHNRSGETVTVHPNKVIIVEGILIFADEALCSLFDVRIFIDTDADVRLVRRIYRDTKRRGRTLESVLNQYMTTVKPMHEKYVDPSRKRADLILPDGGRNIVALDMLFSRVKKHIDDCYHRNGKKGGYKKNYGSSHYNRNGQGNHTYQGQSPSEEGVGSPSKSSLPTGPETTGKEDGGSNSGNSFSE